MLSILRKSSIIKTLSIFIILTLLSCEDKNDVELIVFKDGVKVDSYLGSIYTTKYGGINYFIENDLKRKRLFEMERIDSLIIIFNGKRYTSKPLVRKAFSRERNDSDFSFDIDENKHKIIPDTIAKMETLLLFSEKTNMEKMKKNSTINAKFIDLK
jgi:hypothetical protein